MSRNKHKNHPQDTKAALETLQEARKATQEIKAELLEHNNLIKLHATAEQPESYANNTAPDGESDTSASINDNEKPSSNMQSGSKASREPVHGIKDEPQTSAETKTSGADSSKPGSSPVNLQNIIEPWLNMQFQIARSMSEAWLNMLEKGKSESSET